MIIRKTVALLRRLRTFTKVAGKSYIHYQPGLHIGVGTRLWAPSHINIGENVYIGKQVFIEANCTIGNNVLIANRVGIIGRNDHDFAEIGVPVRFSNWIGSQKNPSKYVHEEVSIDDDVWIGYNCTLLTGVRIGKGSIIAAGSVVTKDIPPYSIVVGVPGRVIRKRFLESEVAEHENLIRNRRFVFSEEGFDYFKRVERTQLPDQTTTNDRAVDSAVHSANV